MTKLTVTIDLDMDAYREKYGPGSEWYTKHCHGPEYNIDTNSYPHLPAEEWEFNKNPKLLEEMVRDILEEGFYDWARQGWLKVDVG